MKPSCERCARALGTTSGAFICSHECTYCAACAATLRRVCPNCDGELVPRPRRCRAVGASSRGEFQAQVFEHREVRAAGLVEHDGWRLKRYEIVASGEGVEGGTFGEGLGLVLAELPTPAVNVGRAGVGFVILHAGMGWDYIVLAFWDSNNELPLRVWSRARTIGVGWAPARADQSVCVWDLRVVAHERDAYVRWVMRAAPDVEGYLGERFEGPA